MWLLSEAVLETRAIPVWHIIIFAVLCVPMGIGVFSVVRGIGGWPIIFIFFGSLFFLFLFSILFGKVEVYEDGITFRMRYVSFDDVGGIRFKWGGRVLVLGKWLDWFILLNPEEFVEAVNAVKPQVLEGYRRPVRRWRPIIYSLIPLASLLALWAMGHALDRMGISIDPLAWAVVWGVVAATTTTAWAYWLPPHRYRIWGLGRLGTALAIGLLIGVPIFLMMLTTLFI